MQSGHWMMTAMEAPESRGALRTLMVVVVLWSVGVESTAARRLDQLLVLGKPGEEAHTHMLHGAGIVTNIYPINEPHVGKYSSTMEHLG